MGIGDWGLGIGDWGLGPIPNPQSPIPNCITTKRILEIINFNNIYYKYNMYLIIIYSIFLYLKYNI